MGTDNADLIRALEAARTRNDASAYNRLSPLVHRSQERCAHPPENRVERLCNKTSKHRRYRRGDVLMYCRKCSKILGVNGRLIDPIEDAAWQKLHPDRID